MHTCVSSHKGLKNRPFYKWALLSHTQSKTTFDIVYSTLFQFSSCACSVWNSGSLSFLLLFGGFPIDIKTEIKSFIICCSLLIQWFCSAFAFTQFAQFLPIFFNFSITLDPTYFDPRKTQVQLKKSQGARALHL